jgi:hypothetical protein
MVTMTPSLFRRSRSVIFTALAERTRKITEILCKTKNTFLLGWFVELQCANCTKLIWPIRPSSSKKFIRVVNPANKQKHRIG